MSADRPVFNPDLAAAPVYASGTSIEEARRRSGCGEILKLASNESPIGPSPRALEAIRECLGRLHLYPAQGDDELRAALARQAGEGITADHVLTGNGGTEVLSLIAAGFLDRGDEAILCPPTFPLYEIFARRRGARVVVCPLRAPEYRYDVDAILAAVTPGTRVVYLCSPVNPTGTLLKRADAERLLAELPARLIVVFDESYRDFVDDPEAAQALDAVRAGRSVIAVRSFSKSHGLAGLRVGYAIAPPEVTRYLWRARQPFHLGAPALAGALAALGDRRHLARTRRVVRAERTFIFRELDRRGLAPTPSQANFVLFRPGVAPEALYERLIARGIIVRPAAFFYVPDAVRVTVGVRAHNERFLATLDMVLAELRAETRA